MDLKSYAKLFLDHAYITDRVLNHSYEGHGTTEDPYLVEWLPNDERNPLRTSTVSKWITTFIMAFTALSVSFASTAFAGAQPQIQADFDVGVELSTLSVSFFVLGFAFGPMLWGSLAELYGRQIWATVTLGLCTIFDAGSCGSQNIETLLILRLLSGLCAGSAIVNTASVISDIFPPETRGFGVSMYSSAPFLGPTLGPICSGFLAAAAGWRWVDGLTVAFTGLMWACCTFLVPETYAPVLLRRRAAKLSQLTGKAYISRIEHDRGPRTASQVFSTALKRPWIILCLEPIALLLAIYAAIVYGTLYLIFSGFPIAFQELRGWSQSITSLSFVGVMVGQILGLSFSIWLDTQYKAKSLRNRGRMTPEDRLRPMMIGGAFMPIGLFWFAFTTYPSVPWIVSLIGSSFFGFGQVLVFISTINYTIDAYTVYAASSLAANAIMRALFGFAFPLFTTQMYHALGVQWASAVPAFLALACLPVPFLFWRYGGWIRLRSPYSEESARITSRLYAQGQRTSRSGNGQAHERGDSEVPSHVDDEEKQEFDEGGGGVMLK